MRATPARHERPVAVIIRCAGRRGLTAGRFRQCGSGTGLPTRPQPFCQHPSAGFARRRRPPNPLAVLGQQRTPRTGFALHATGISSANTQVTGNRTRTRVVWDSNGSNMTNHFQSWRRGECGVLAAAWLRARGQLCDVVSMVVRGSGQAWCCRAGGAREAASVPSVSATR